jgi:hypothetical protein
MKQLFKTSSAILAALLLGLAGQVNAAETTPPTAVDILSCSNFLVLSGAGIQDLTSSVVFNGNIGTSPIAGSAITGITQARVIGSIYCVDASGPAGSIVDPTTLTTAKGDMTTAYNDAMGRVLARVTQAQELGGLTLAPGLYWSATGFDISTGDLTLDPGANPNAVWIFMAGTAGSPTDVNLLTTHKIILAGTALASNVFWACRSAIIGTSTEFRGIVLADQTITNAGGSLFEGRMLAFSAGVTFNGAAFTGVGVPGSFATPTSTSTPSATSTATPTGTATPSATPTSTQTSATTGTSTVTSTTTTTPTVTVTGTGGAPAPVQGGSYIFPSPSTGDTARIVYTMKSAGSVKIKIYNEIGRLVDSLEEDKPVGWQGTQVSVGRFAPGTYYYVLTQIYSGSTEVQSAHKFAVVH